MTDRANLLLLLNAARLASRPDYIRHVAADWLGVWPGDREVTRLLAAAESELGFDTLASARLSAAVMADPEDAVALDALGASLRKQGLPDKAQVFDCASRALRRVPMPEDAPRWAALLARAVASLQEGNAASAIPALTDVLTAKPDTPLPTLLAMQVASRAGEADTALAHAERGVRRWPATIAFRLTLARHWIAQGETVRAIDALHRCAADDPTAAIAIRYLGADSPYLRLWPTALVASLSRPIPADVAAVLGENRLAPAAPEAPDESHTARAAAAAALAGAAAEAVQPEPWEAFQGPDADGLVKNEAAEDVRQELQRLAVRLNAAQAARATDRRSPVYVIAAAKTRLMQEFGRDVFRRIDEALIDLHHAVSGRKGWSAVHVYLDDASSLKSFGLAPGEPSHAWQLKLRLADLDRALSRRNQRIGAVLIIGGPKLFPFHELPNPTDDDDTSVPSDNPYTTSDENYFVPEWPVGRLPVDSDPDLLVRLIRRAADHHLALTEPAGLIGRMRFWLHRRAGRVFTTRLRAFGYSASIWRRASMAVYKPIGEPNALVTSPPAAAGAMPAVAARPSRLSYYNLHGVEDSPEWFGQRDPVSDDLATVEFPVALRPADVVNGGRAPAVVFSEACYGAHVTGKSQETALSLKFLASGSHSVVGSTKISYGSVNTPLIAADLLGKLYWEQLGQGIPSGEALRRAKLNLAAEMLRRQSYLDGEDQKTLISFVHYGDPLYVADPARSQVDPKAFARRRPRPALPTMACALGGECGPVATLDPASVEKVRLVVAQYLPGMANAASKIHRQRCGCDGKDHVCLAHATGVKAAVSGPETTVVTLSKQVDAGDIRHKHFARLTLDRTGRILKLAVSR
jgi:tetratricopeptide (TPR) repeat protein